MFSSCLVAFVPPGWAADSWGGSLAATSDYLVRGISRTNDHAALQLDLHYFDPSGVLAGVVLSNAQFAAGQSADAETDLYGGFAWALGGDWRSKIIGNFYAYPGSREGARYHYLEAGWDLEFRDWLDLRVAYSPDMRRFVPYRGLLSAGTESLEVNLQQSLGGHLTAAGGIGYSYLQGTDGGGYAYWSAGAAYEAAPVSLSVFYVDTTSDASSLYYKAVSGRHWLATIIWKF